MGDTVGIALPKPSASQEGEGFLVKVRRLGSTLGKRCHGGSKPSLDGYMPTPTWSGSLVLEFLEATTDFDEEDCS